MCHISRHIWKCHRGNKCAVGTISERGEIQVMRSVFVRGCVCVCVSSSAHTHSGCGMKEVLSCIIPPLRLCSLSLLSLSSSRPRFDSAPRRVLPRCCHGHSEVVAFAQCTLELPFILSQAARTNFFFFFLVLQLFWGWAALMGEPPQSVTHPADKTDLHPADSRAEQIAALRAF